MRSWPGLLFVLLSCTTSLVVASLGGKCACPPAMPGPVGPRGFQGERGSPGPVGPPGRPGNPGNQGVQGSDGAPLPRDALGRAMVYGAQGPRGAPGAAGAPGECRYCPPRSRPRPGWLGRSMALNETTAAQSRALSLQEFDEFQEALEGLRQSYALLLPTSTEKHQMAIILK